MISFSHFDNVLKTSSPEIPMLIFINGFYRPPDGKVDEFVCELDRILQELVDYANHVVIILDDCSIYLSQNMQK